MAKKADLTRLDAALDAITAARAELQRAVEAQDVQAASKAAASLATAVEQAAKPATHFFNVVFRDAAHAMPPREPTPLSALSPDDQDRHLKMGRWDGRGDWRGT